METRVVTAMDRNTEAAVFVTDEQYSILIEELVPTIVAFYNSEEGKKLFAEYLKEKRSDNSKDAA